VLHGGAVMTLADSLGAVCAFLNLPDGSVTSTIESKTNFLRAVRDRHVEGRTEPLHVGRTTIVLQTELRDAEGRRVAHVVQTQAVTPTAG
jgi:1,4-dihydroxy-2-naphthoyl-CoA hydrolase